MSGFIVPAAVVGTNFDGVGLVTSALADATSEFLPVFGLVVGVTAGIGAAAWGVKKIMSKLGVRGKLNV